MVLLFLLIIAPSKPGISVAALKKLLKEIKFYDIELLESIFLVISLTTLHNSEGHIVMNLYTCNLYAVDILYLYCSCCTSS